MQRLVNLLTSRRFPFWLLTAAFVLVLPSLWTGWVLDDYIHRLAFSDSVFAERFGISPSTLFTFLDGDPERTRALRDLGVVPWWTLEGVQIAFWRPVAAAFHGLDYALWADSPLLMHLQNVFWYVASAAVLLSFFRRFVGATWVAGLAALLYAVDDAHFMPIAWIANRNTLVSVVFGGAALIAHDRWRRDRRADFGAVSFALFALALLSNEGAVAVAGYLFAYAVFLDRGEWTRRALTLAPYAVVVVIWRMAYRGQGYGTWGSIAYVDPLTNSAEFLTAVFLQGPVLLASQWFMLPADNYMFLHGVQLYAFVIVAYAIVAVVWALLWPLLRTDAVARFFVTGMLIAAIPGCTTRPSERMLFFIGIGAMGVLAQYIAHVSGAGGIDRLPAYDRRIHRATFRVFLVLHLIAAPVLLPLKVSAFAWGGRQLVAGVDEAPVDEDRIAEQTIVVVGAPLFLIPTHIVLRRELQGKALPAAVVPLSSNGGGILPEELTRVDERTIELKADHGFTFFLLRDNRHPFTVGETVQLSDVRAEVLEVDDRGHALRVRYVFSAPLEDPSYHWLRMEGFEFEPFAPPAPGETVRVQFGDGGTASAIRAFF